MPDFRADLSGRVALVTGGASGIGLATARLFAASGAHVAINHLPGDQAALDTVAEMIAEGRSVFSAPGNVSEAGECTAMVQKVVKDAGRLDYLINNAGSSATTVPIEFSDLDAISEEFWSLILSTNLVAPFRCAKAARGALIASRGAIVNTASNAGITTRGSSIAYAASKAGLINMTKSLARALAPHVRVNAVAPGLVDTAWTRSWPEARKKQAIDRSFLARMASTADIS